MQSITKPGVCSGVGAAGVSEMQPLASFQRGPVERPNGSGNLELGLCASNRGQRSQYTPLANSRENRGGVTQTRPPPAELGDVQMQQDLF